MRRILITITRRRHTRRMNWTNFIIGCIYQAILLPILAQGG